MKDVGEAISLQEIKSEGRVIRGNQERLSSSIALDGLRDPVILAPDNTLLSGYRRVDAAARLGWGIIGYRRVTYLEEACAAMAQEINGPEWVPPTAYDMWVMGRRLEALPRRQSATASGMHLRDLIGQAFGVSSSTYQRAKAIYHAAAVKDDPVAMEGTRRLERGEPIGGVFDWWRAQVNPPRRTVVPENATLEQLGEPPAPQAKSPLATELRCAFIREMSKAGATSEQIAERLGINAEHVRRLAKKINVEIKADAVTIRARRNPIDSNAVLARAVEDLDAIKWSLSQVDARTLDDARAEQWARDLSSFANQARQLAKRIRTRKEGTDDAR